MRERVVADAVKRSFDVVVAACGLVVLSPVLGVVAVAVRWRLGCLLYTSDAADE